MSEPNAITVNRYDVADKVVVITGGGTGIGKAITEAFLANGARVVVSGRRREPLDDVTAGAGENARVVVGDVSRRDDVATLIRTAVDEFGRVDAVISNAGVHAGGEFTELSEDEWTTVRNVNIDGFVHLAQLSLPELAKTRGTFIAVSSVSGLAGDWGQAAYNATKHAVNGFVRSLALDWGARGVRINAVAPAFTLTDMTAGLAGDDAAIKPFVDRVALDRPGTPEDIAPTVVFLATDDAKYITGAILPVDGGTTASTGQPHI